MKAIINYRIASYLHGKLFSRTCQNSLETEMLTEEKFAKCAMALIMIMFVCAYNISAIHTHVSFSIWALSESLIFLYGFLFLPSVAFTATATSLFASLMADGGIIVERSPFRSGSFLTGF